MNNPFETILDKLNNLESMVSDLKVELAQYKQPQRRTGVPLAQEVTGLARSTIYNMVCARKIPHYKKNGKLIFDEGELRAWWLEGKRQTLDELAA